MFTEPLAGWWWDVAVRERKTKLDWALEMARLLEGRYAACEKVIVVCDNLNTHTTGAFDEAFDPERARSLVRRITSLPAIEKQIRLEKSWQRLPEYATSTWSGVSRRRLRRTFALPRNAL